MQPPWSNSCRKALAQNALGDWGVKGQLAYTKGRNLDTGDGLVNPRASHTWKRTRLDFGVENLFDKLYSLPTGDAHVGQGMTMSINGIPWGIAVPGMGRSFYAGLSLDF